MIRNDGVDIVTDSSHDAVPHAYHTFQCHGLERTECVFIEPASWLDRCRATVAAAECG